MSDEDISVRSETSAEDFQSEAEEIEEEPALSEEKGEDDDEEDEANNAEPDAWIDDDFDDAQSQSSENGIPASGTGISSFVQAGFSCSGSQFETSVVVSTAPGSSSNAGAASKKKITAKQSNNYMTVYEFTKIIGVRSEQIMHGSQVLIQTNSTDPIEIAKEELRAGMIPLRIRRTLPEKGGVRTEDWSVSEFLNIDTLLNFYNY